MSIKNRTIIIFFFLFLPLFITHAITALELAINDQLKECRPFQPMGDIKLPDGWKFHDNLNTDSSAIFKVACEKIGYTYIDDELVGRINLSYLMMVILYNSIFLFSIIALIVYYLKTKKKKIIIALLFLIFAYLFLYYIRRSMV